VATDADVEIDDEGELLGQCFAGLGAHGIDMTPSPSGGGLGWGRVCAFLPGSAPIPAFPQRGKE
jgi:hypothetical protein